MARKVILDVDPGIDDAVALALALFDPELEVVAVTATGGNVPPAMATTNAQKVIEQLDPPRWPRIGAAPIDNPLPIDALHLNGPDGLGQSEFPVAGLANLHPAEKVLTDELRAAPEMVTIIALGPLTNLAHVLHRESHMAAQVGRLIVGGGCVAVPGNVTPCAEFNIYSDPLSARQVIRSPMTKTIVPLDVTQQLLMTFDLLDQLPSETTKGGAFLRKILPYAFRAYRQFLGQEGIYLHAPVALAAATHPELFETEEEVACDVETEGELTSGATIFDRRNVRQWRPNTDLVVGMDVAAVRDVILRGLARVGQTM
jgi:purine nucleosidase